VNINEAIKHSLEIASDENTCKECKDQHKQLAVWLEELKNARIEIENLNRKNAERHELFMLASKGHYSY
jgi:hypothetical protein